MEIKFTEKEKKAYLMLAALLLIFAGLGFSSEGLFTKTVTINPAETQVNAYLHRRSTWPPFKNIDDVVPNVKQAVMTTNYGKYLNSYAVELETYNSKYNKSIKDYSYLPYFAKNLQNKINEAIQNKTSFTITFRETSSVVAGLLFILAGISMLLYNSLKTKYKEQLYAQARERVRERKRKRDLRRAETLKNEKPEEQK
jgi:hypothetical protein